MRNRSDAVPTARSVRTFHEALRSERHLACGRRRRQTASDQIVTSNFRFRWHRHPECPGPGGEFVAGEDLPLSEHRLPTGQKAPPSACGDSSWGAGVFFAQVHSHAARSRGRGHPPRGWNAANVRLRHLRRPLTNRLVGPRAVRHIGCASMWTDRLLKDAVGKLPETLGIRSRRWTSMPLRSDPVIASSLHMSLMHRSSRVAGRLIGTFDARRRSKPQ